MHAFKAIGHETISIGQSKRQRKKEQLSLFINRDTELCYSAGVSRTERAVAALRTPQALYPIARRRIAGVNPNKQFVLSLEPDLCVFAMDDGFSVLPTFSDKHVIIDFSQSKSRYQVIGCADLTIIYVLDLQENRSSPSPSRYYLKNDPDYGRRYQQLAYDCGLPKLRYDILSGQWSMNRTGFVDIEEMLSIQHEIQLQQHNHFVLC